MRFRWYKTWFSYPTLRLYAVWILNDYQQQQISEENMSSVRSCISLCFIFCCFIMAEILLFIQIRPQSRYQYPRCSEYVDSITRSFHNNRLPKINFIKSFELLLLCYNHHDTSHFLNIHNSVQIYLCILFCTCIYHQMVGSATDRK